ncbi:MAG: hypothetical protein K2O99_11985, partial [Lachnospiraceae bacterium]|nr:hypothetical protein [Lachnospiraceae bacterium]
MEALKEEVDMEGALPGTEPDNALDPEEEIVENGVHNYSTKDRYVWSEDPKVLRKIEWFRDQKLGLMMH